MEGSNRKFDISHLNQPPDEKVCGPIQDSEALLLYALVKVCQVRKAIEIGGLNGYSCRNFLRAMGERGTMYTVDVNHVPTQAPNHIFIRSDIRHVDPERFGKEPFDLVFFDCHSYEAQMVFLERMEAAGLVDKNTILVFHDTNPHPYKSVHWCYQNSKGEWIHQTAERQMVNSLAERGWHPVCMHTQPDRHGPHLPYRHGLTLMRKFERLEN